jgi:cytochrome c556
VIIVTGILKGVFHTMKLIQGILLAVVLTITTTLTAVAGDPIETRHELMEDAKKGAKTIGGMLKGEKEFDAEEVMQGLVYWQTAANEFGDLFPQGSEQGGETRALPAVWSERERFNSILTTFGETVEEAIAANPQSLDELKAVAGPIFDTCKSCHEDYRAEED